MSVDSKAVLTLEGVTPDNIPFDTLFKANQPVVMPGLAKDWPLVQAGLQSVEATMQMLEEFDSGRPVGVFTAPPSAKGRFVYEQSRSGFNFESKRLPLLDVLSSIRDTLGKESHPYYYINSLVFHDGFPELNKRNTLNFDHDVFQSNIPLSKIWLGTQSIASAHYDLPNNLACCVLGKRRFTLFPPDQIHNLYPGPMEATPGGQVVTMTDLNAPDFERFPRLEEALKSAYIVDMEPGDALYYPSMWWHQVQAYDEFNVMVNYWWASSPRYMGNPIDVILHGILSLRDRPQAEKEAWREHFDYYVFGDAENTRAHVPESMRGSLDPVDEIASRRIRAQLKNKLNR